MYCKRVYIPLAQFPITLNPQPQLKKKVFLYNIINFLQQIIEVTFNYFVTT